MPTEYSFTCPCCGNRVVIYGTDKVETIQEVDTPEDNQLAFELGYVLAKSNEKE